VAAAAELYRAILDDIEEHDYDVFSRRAFVPSSNRLRQLPGIWWRVSTNRYGRLEPQAQSAVPEPDTAKQEFAS
jgi:15-cis-phytoene synthase